MQQVINSDRRQSASLRADLTVYWWRHGLGSENFGDALTQILLNDLLDVKIRWGTPRHADLMGVGSIIEHWETSGQKIRGTPAVWGSGFIRSRAQVLDLTALTVLALRGLLTASRVVTKEPVLAFGDPGLLVKKIVEVPSRKTYDIGFVPNYADFELWSSLKNMRGVQAHVINPTSPSRSVLDQIASCRTIVSSSLHGLVVADALGIPSTWVKSKRVTGGSFKFLDYFSALENANRLTISSLEGLKSTNDLVRQTEESSRIPSNIDAINEALLKALGMQFGGNISGGKVQK